MSRTRKAVLVFPCFILLCGGAAADAPQLKSRSAKVLSLDGVWAVVTLEKAGEKATAEAEILKDFRLTVRDGKLILEALGQTEGGAYRLDIMKRPMHLDITADAETAKGIFLFEGKTLTLCVAEPGAPRPTAFASAGTNNLLLVLKRKR